MDAHYSCRECYAKHDPCETCWVLIDEGTHPQQPQNIKTESRPTMKLHWRTNLYLKVIIPLRVYARNRTLYLLQNAVDKLDLENSRRYDGSVRFRDFVMDDDLSFYTDEVSYQLWLEDLDDDDYNY